MNAGTRQRGPASLSPRSPPPRRWLTLALKRVITSRTGGYDKGGFCEQGDQSAERYDLSKQVKSIDYQGNDTEIGAWITQQRQRTGKMI